MRQRATATKKKLLVEGFDELNVMKALDALYEALDEEARKMFAALYVAKYRETVQKQGKRPKKESIIDEMAEMYLAEMLSEPDPVTLYAWDAEVLRKRDRAKESVNAVPTKAQKQLEIDKAIRLWSRQMQQYADETTDVAMLAAYKDCGVRRVQWIAQNDEKVCRECRDLHGEIFDLDEAPTKKHPRCRCWLKPV